jgi:hypothetical protein
MATSEYKELNPEQLKGVFTPAEGAPRGLPAGPPPAELSIDELEADAILGQFMDAADCASGMPLGARPSVNSLQRRIAACDAGSAERRAAVFAALDALLPRGRKVVLTGLEAKPELNGCWGVVLGKREGERFPVQTIPTGGDDKKQQQLARVWNLRPATHIPPSPAGPKPPSREEIKSATVQELQVIGREFAKVDGRVALYFLETLQERANQDADLSSPWHGHLLGRAGVDTLVVDTMRSHLQREHKANAENAAVQRMGCLALWSMTCVADDNDSDASNERRQHAADAGALPLIATVMRAYEEKHPEVCQAACMAIYNIAGGSNSVDACPGGEGIREAAAKAGVIETILTFLRRHAQEPNAGALSNGSKCYAEVGLKALGNITPLARSRDGTVQRADSTVPSLYLPCTFPVPSLYLPCRCSERTRLRPSSAARASTGIPPGVSCHARPSSTKR